METYVVKLDPPKLKLKQRAVAALGGAAIYFVIVICWKYFWPSEAERRGGPTGILLEASVMALFWGVAMSFLTPRYKLPNYTIIVEDEAITGVWEYSRLKWLAIRKTVHKARSAQSANSKGNLVRQMAFCSQNARNSEPERWDRSFFRTP